jgi:hypothetical protein
MSADVGLPIVSGGKGQGAEDPRQTSVGRCFNCQTTDRHTGLNPGFADIRARRSALAPRHLPRETRDVLHPLAHTYGR